MRWVNLLLCGILLSGCVREQPLSETISESAINATTALEQSLPVECKTDAIIMQTAVIKTQIRAIEKACASEKAQITREKMKWFWSFWGLVAVIGLYIVRKILK